MSVWTLIQVVCNLLFFAGFAIVAMRLRRPPQDDPRLSRGLQLLQTKITILEDLSDRTDQQFKQLNSMLEQKTRQLQNKILEAEQEILKIDHSMNKSMEVAEIFQDKIPHEEILERQRTIEYIKAARMSHSGMNVEDIFAQVNLPREQVELIAKFNRDQLMFDEDQLPDWAKKGAANAHSNPTFGLGNVDFVQSLDTHPTDLSNVQRLDREFKQAVQTAKHEAENPPAGLNLPHINMPHINMPQINMPQITLPNISMPNIDTTAAREFMAPAVSGIKQTAETIKQKLVSTAEDLLSTSHSPSSQPTQTAPIPPETAHSVGANGKKDPVIKKVIFPRIQDPNV